MEPKDRMGQWARRWATGRVGGGGHLLEQQTQAGFFPMALGKSCLLCGPRFPHLCNGTNHPCLLVSAT